MLLVRKLCLNAHTVSMSSTKMFSTITVDLGSPFLIHNCESPSTTVTVTKQELFDYLKTMYTMRRMEIMCDTEYKAHNIRGFCHLYDGQEAIPTGVR